MTTPSSDHTVDFEELCWLVGRYRRSGEDIGPNDINGRKFWLDNIREDYGEDVMTAVLRCIEVEDRPRLAIEAARVEWRQRAAETYLYVLEAYNRREQP